MLEAMSAKMKKQPPHNTSKRRNWGLTCAWVTKALNSSLMPPDTVMSLNIPSSLEVNWQPHSVWKHTTQCQSKDHSQHSFKKMKKINNTNKKWCAVNSLKYNENVSMKFRIFSHFCTAPNHCFFVVVLFCCFLYSWDQSIITTVKWPLITER